MRSLQAGVLALTLGLGGCGADRAAGGSGSETTNTVRVVVLDPSGRPIAGARVFLRDAEDTTTGGGAPTDGNGVVRLDLPDSGASHWLEASADGNLAALRVGPLDAGGTLTLEARPAGNVELRGLPPGARVSLPGLGRSDVADPSGIVRLGGLPTGAVRVRWSLYDGPLPVVGSASIRVDDAADPSTFPWPADGSLDSSAVRRFLELSGLSRVSTDSVGKRIEGRMARLDLSGRGLASLHGSIRSLSFLRELDLSDNRLASLPRGLDRLPRLSFVDLARNPLDSFPSGLAGLDSLRILELDSTGIAAVPEWIADLPSLWYLGLGRNRLEALPARLPELGGLAILAIQRNRLAALPEGVHRMDSLREVWAETNALRRLPDSVFLCPRLRVLQLDNNPLDSLPARLGELPLLRDLRLTGTGLHALPASLAAVPLERLDVWGLALCTQDPVLEPWLDSLAGPDWRATRAASCP